jgi:hypothetical protein
MALFLDQKELCGFKTDLAWNEIKNLKHCDAGKLLFASNILHLNFISARCF